MGAKRTGVGEHAGGTHGAGHGSTDDQPSLPDKGLRGSTRSQMHDLVPVAGTAA
jgi:hypothetical protein